MAIRLAHVVRIHVHHVRSAKTDWNRWNHIIRLMLVVVNTCCGGSGGSGCYTLSGSNEYISWWLQRWDLQLGGKQKLTSVARQRKNLWSWPPGQATRNCASGGIVFDLG